MRWVLRETGDELLGFTGLGLGSGLAPCESASGHLRKRRRGYVGKPSHGGLHGQRLVGCGCGFEWLAADGGKSE